MVKVRLGAWGTGKTAAMTEDIVRLASKGERVLLFVPDQFSFEAERQMYIKAGARNIPFIKVTSFAKISREILTKFRKAKPYADETVKLVTMLQTVRELRDSLEFFGEAAEKPGFAAQMLKAAASFRNAGITPAQLKTQLNTGELPDSGLMEKASDIQMIYEAYDRALTASLDDKLDDVSRSAAVAEEKGFFREYHCFFDNFDSFSGTQRKLLDVISRHARSVTVCLSEGSGRSLRCTEKTLGNLRRLGETEIIRHQKPFRKPLQLVIDAKNPFDEADYIAAEICRLVREEGVRYRDVLVLTTDGAYEQPLTDAFYRCNIPAFFDFPRPMLTKPAVKYILTLLEAAELKPDRLLAYLRSGFVRIKNDRQGKSPTRPLGSTEISRLEEMAVTYGFGAEQWTKPVRETLPKLPGRGGREAWEKQLDLLEQLRLAVMTPLLSLKERLEASENGRQFTEILVRFLTEEQALKATFLARSKSGGGEGTDYLKLSRESMEEYGRIWEKLVSVFDSLAYCMGGMRVSISEYRRILESVLSGMTLAKPPAVLDSVTVGDTERTRRSGVSVLFVCGAWDGAFPRRAAGTGVFSADEQEQLAACGVELEETGLLRRSKELYFAQRSLALPEKRLVVSCPRQDFSGTERSLSPTADLPKAERLEAEAFPIDYYAVTEGAVEKIASECFGRDRGAFEKLAALSPSRKAFYGKLKKAAEMAEGITDLHISPEAAGALFSDSYSPTRLDSAFGCLFSHFCKYGLKLGETEEKDPEAPNTVGSAVHEIMEILAEKGFLTDKNADLEEAVDSVLKQELGLMKERGFHDTDRVNAVLTRLRPQVIKLAENVREELLQSGYNPVRLEEKVSYSCGEVTISGIADRIDEKKGADGLTYARICDYKTGKKELDPETVWNGLDLQMLLYLFAYCDETGAKPGAVMYVPSGKEPAFRGAREDYTDGARLTNWLDSHRPSALVLADSPAETAVAEYEGSLRMRTGATDKKHFVKAQSMTAEQLSALRRHIEQELIIPRTKRIKSGDISPLPLAWDEEDSACRYCPFGDFCGNRDGFKAAKTPIAIPAGFYCGKEE